MEGPGRLLLGRIGCVSSCAARPAWITSRSWWWLTAAVCVEIHKGIANPGLVEARPAIGDPAQELVRPEPSGMSKLESAERPGGAVGNTSWPLATRAAILASDLSADLPVPGIAACAVVRIGHHWYGPQL